jgi:uncharacterized Ntn-hydrolase superfamily protein
VSNEGEPERTVADAASAAADETVEAIATAAEQNRDPVVERALDDASLKAEKTASRVGWLRSAIRRIFASHDADDARPTAS